ncbi:hypothetical protein STBA_15320 [Streptomyces sp. MP131-18]|nr:hypothetical protein STBA_15320 [Streptomyces sp. MP131-18]
MFHVEGGAGEQQRTYEPGYHDKADEGAAEEPGDGGPAARYGDIAPEVVVIRHAGYLSPDWLKVKFIS